MSPVQQAQPLTVRSLLWVCFSRRRVGYALTPAEEAAFEAHLDEELAHDAEVRAAVQANRQRRNGVSSEEG